MAEHADREHFLPIRKDELIDLLCRDQSLLTGRLPTAEEQDGFRRFCTILSAYFHHEFHQRLEVLKRDYAPFDPDADIKPLKILSDSERESRYNDLFSQFDQVLQRANFVHLSKEQITAATEAVSAWGINLDVDFGVFDRLEIYYRGKVKGTRGKGRWYWPWKIDQIPVEIYQRLVMVFRQRPHRRLGKSADTKNVYLKIFKDIPTVDLEMLLPGGRWKMPGLERGKLGASFLSAVAFAGWKIFNDFKDVSVGLLTKNPLLMYGPLSLILGYGYKQYAGFQMTKRAYTSRLTESLYYQILDSNAGVLYRLLDEAEEQDCREAILAYFHLWRNAPAEGWTIEQLDDYIELDLERRLNMKVDFEVGDAMEKVERLGIVKKAGDRYRAIPIQQALVRIDEIWDNYFTYNNDAKAAGG